MLAFLVNYPEPHHLPLDARRQQGPDLTQSLPKQKVNL